MRRAAWLLPCAAPACAALAGCSRNPSILLEPAGPHAESIAALFWLFFWICAAVWVAVLGFLGFALLRRRGAGPDTPGRPGPAQERRLGRWVGGGVILTAAILTLLVGASFATDRRLLALEEQPELEVQVTANQWWWEIRYRDPVPGRQFVTANELHLPVGRPVKLVLRSNDVIHSLWLPNIAGKRDIIPGVDNSAVIRVDRAGIWRGRCAEFCGYQHAFMGLTLVAQPQAEFDAWRDAQLRPAAEPQTEAEQRGQQAFNAGPCTLCHVVRSSSSAGYSANAPELTHLKSRMTIGAGAAPNTKGHLGGWIIDPHGLKPGAHMPAILQDPDTFQDLLAYLESLR